MVGIPNWKIGIKTFKLLGVGMVLIIDEIDVDTICNNIKGSYVIGRVIEGKKGVSLI